MNKQLEFLRKPIKDEFIVEDSYENTVLRESYQELKNNLGVSDHVSLDRKLSLKPERFERQQIWKCKTEYYDVLGNFHRGDHPYLVIIVNEPDKLEAIEFVRVQPISPFTEFKADDDIYIDDPSIVGFEFLIESWNEQPITVDLLEEYVNILDCDISELFKDRTVQLNPEQAEFRKLEIDNTSYLRQSISSVLQLNEHSEKNQILINIDNRIIPCTENKDSNNKHQILNEQEIPYLQAAKKGKSKDRVTYDFTHRYKNIDLGFKIIKDSNQFILSVRNPSNVVLKDNFGTVVEQTQKSLFTDLESGVYVIEFEEIENSIRIVLK